jgi:hypothetical protein
MIKLFKSKKQEPTIFDQTPTFRTIRPANRPSFNEWAREYKVSSCYERVKYVYVYVNDIL